MKKGKHYNPTDKTLIGVYALNRLGWTQKEIACKFGVTQQCISLWLKRGYKKIKELDIVNSSKSEEPQIRYVGDTKDLEYIEGKQNQNICGGGRWKKGKIYDDNWE